MISKLLYSLYIILVLSLSTAGANVQPASATVPSANWVERIPVDTPQVRYGHAMAYDTRRGITVLFGGVYVSGLLNDTLELGGTTWVKRTPLNAPSPRYGHAMAYDSVRGETVLFGGCPRGDTWVWDGTNWTERHPTSSPPELCQPMMAFDSLRGVVVLFGGIVSNVATTSDTWEWDGTNWSKKNPFDSPSARYGGGMAFDSARGVVVLYSGASAGYNSTSDTWEWDGTNWTLRSTIGPPPRLVPSMAYDSLTHRVVMFGGQSSSGDVYGDTWEWDGNAGTWTQRVVPVSPEPRISAMVFDEAHGVSVLFGGQGSETRLYEDTWEWNSTTGRWTNTVVPTSPPGSGSVMAYDSARREVVLFGSDYSAGGTWTLGGSATSWIEHHPVSRPPSRSNHSMAFDSGRGVTVLFGGSQILGHPPFLNDTWEWDGTNWIERHPVNPPPARYNHTMAYDSARGVTVLFGGRDGGTLGDTWEWNGIIWTQRFPAHSPSPRLTQMAYDSRRGVVVLFGGVALTGSQADTWEWNGSDWVLRTPSNAPSAREQNGLAYDSARGVTVLFGGVNGGTNDTWEWDGTNWIQNTSASGPRLGTVGPEMVYDSARQAIVLFGPGNVLADDTWEYVSSSPPNNPPTADAGGPYYVDEGASITVTASGNDPEQGPLTFAWDLDNNGTFETPGQSVTFSATGLSAPDSRTITVRATDDGGLTATDQATVNVIYIFSAFLQPVDNPPTFNEVKSGAGVPVNFSLGGDKGLSIFESGYPKSQQIDCDSTAPVDGIEATVTAGSSSLTYDASTGTYTYVWKTDKAWAGTCRQLILSFNDGASYQAYFKLK